MRQFSKHFGYCRNTGTKRNRRNEQNERKWTNQRDKCYMDITKYSYWMPQTKTNWVCARSTVFYLKYFLAFGFLSPFGMQIISFPLLWISCTKQCIGFIWKPVDFKAFWLAVHMIYFIYKLFIAQIKFQNSIFCLEKLKNSPDCNQKLLINRNILYQLNVRKSEIYYGPLLHLPSFNPISRQIAGKMTILNGHRNPITPVAHSEAEQVLIIYFDIAKFSNCEQLMLRERKENDDFHHQDVHVHTFGIHLC